MGKLSLAEWLGAEYNVPGTEVSLPDKFGDALLDAAAANKWSMKDVPSFQGLDESQKEVASKMLKARFEALFKDLISESEAAVAAAKSGTALSMNHSEKFCFNQWLDGFVEKDGGPSSSALSPEQEKQLQADLAAQGMISAAELAWFELTRHTGRAAAPGDVEGAKYLQSAATTKGGVAFRKGKEQSYTEVLRESLAAGDFERVSRWHERLVEVFQASGHRFSQSAAVLVMGMMQKVTQAFGRGR